MPKLCHDQFPIKVRAGGGERVGRERGGGLPALELGLGPMGWVGMKGGHGV